MRRSLLLAGMAAVVVLPAASPRVSAHSGRPAWESPGSLVGVSVEVDGRWVPLYRAPDGSGRYYVEARRGARYSVRLDNRSHERLGVALTVDGLNVISGQKAGAGPGRMYVLDPWDSTEVQGWRTDLESVQRFTFVDEGRSYAVRSGKANAKMGWIEVAVYRERRPRVHREREVTRPWPGYEGRDQPDRNQAPEEKSARDGSGGVTGSAPPAAAAPAPADRHAEGSRSYPGTGWGPRADDPAVVVQFDAQPRPAEQITVRYEYARALRALGIFPDRWPPRDRLWERENARDGFAQPPRR